MAARLRVLGNLDCEARWSQLTLPRRVLDHISAAATLLRFLFDEPIALWTPSPVDPGRLPALDGAQALELHHGPVWTQADAAWGAFRDGAPPAARDRRGLTVPARLSVAKAVNDRRFLAALAQRLEVAPPGMRAVTSLDELRQHLAQGGAAASPTAQWICKAPLTAAGRDRVLGAGVTLSGELERALARLLQRFSALLFEPWLARILDLGVCATVGPGGEVVQRPPHTLLTTARGGFLGIATTPPPLDLTQRAQLDKTVAAVGQALHAAGYVGPFAVDAFLHRAANGQALLHPLCEINGRLSFGWIAAVLAERFGTRELRFSAPPPGAVVLVAPSAPTAPTGQATAGGEQAVAAWIR